MALIDGLEEAAPRTHQRSLPILRRSRLDALLADDQRRPVTVVAGPPGIGKSTFVSTWASSRPAASVGWLTIADEHDAARSLAAALRRTTSALRPSSANNVVVVDGVHRLRSNGAGDAMRRFVGNAPEGLDLVLLSRAPVSALDLFLPPALVGVIDERELAFSAAEARELFSSCGLRLRRDDVVALWQWTEGWVGCLVQLATTVSRGADPHRLASDEAAIESAMRDFLTNEVVSELDPESQRLLMHTSIVDRISRELAYELTGDEDAAQRLATMELSGMLGSTLTDEWFGQRPLVAAHFRAQLRREDPGLAGRLHATAAEWFVSKSMSHEAEKHARAAEDWPFLGELTARRWIDTIDSWGEATVGSLDLPAEAIPQSMLLSAVAVGQASSEGDATVADQYIDSLDHVASDGSVDTAVLVAQLLYGCAFGSSERAIGAGQALAGHRVSRGVRRFARLRRVELLLDRGDLPGARLLLDELVQTDAGSSSGEVDAMLALLLALQGQARAALRLASAAAADRVPVTPRVQHVLSLAEVLARAQAGQRRRKRSLPDDLAPESALSGSHALSKCLKVVRASAREQTWLDADTARHPLAARALVALGIVEVIDATGASLAVGGPAECAVRQARAALSGGSPRSALTVLEPWSGRTGEVHPRTGVELATLSAVTTCALGSTDEAMPHLDTALDLAQRHGVSAPLVEHGVVLSPMLFACATRSGRHQALALLLLDTIEPTPSPAFIEPLTDRELVVLQLLPTLMSNREIAEIMQVSVNTVKTHLKSLYRKLGVDRRREAVVRARQLGLI